jgi:hypothetical protein
VSTGEGAVPNVWKVGQSALRRGFQLSTFETPDNTHHVLVYESDAFDSCTRGFRALKVSLFHKKRGQFGKSISTALKRRYRSTTVAGAFPKFSNGPASITLPIQGDKTVSYARCSGRETITRSRPIDYLCSALLHPLPAGQSHSLSAPEHLLLHEESAHGSLVFPPKPSYHMALVTMSFCLQQLDSQTFRTMQNPGHSIWPPNSPLQLLIIPLFQFS